MTPAPASHTHLPDAPFRGLEPYRFFDRAIFFERENDTRKLV